MAVYNLYSKRNRARDAQDDVLRYDFIPEKLRTQLVQILGEMIGLPQRGTASMSIYEQSVKALKKEYGLQNLAGYSQNAYLDFTGFFRSAPTEQVLDALELITNIAADIFETVPSYARQVVGVESTYEQAVEEINFRFRESAVGYELNGREVIRIDSQVIHAEAVVPVLVLLRAGGFDGPNAEFREAHERYRHGDVKNAILNAAKAFESVMKSICVARGWEVAKDATAKPLIAAIIRNGLFPPYMESQLNDVQRVLESGVGMIRNKTSGHGDGPTALSVDEFYARYALNLSATTMLFLLEAHLNKS